MVITDLSGRRRSVGLLTTFFSLRRRLVCVSLASAAFLCGSSR